MDFVLYKPVYQRYQSPKECSCNDLSKFYRLLIRRTKRQTSNGPWQGSYKVWDHEDIVPIVIIRRSDISPSSACKRPENTHTNDEFSHSSPWPWSEKIPYYHESESRTWGNCNKKLENGSFRISISDCRRYRREPLVWKALDIILGT